jgi:hypothetical protein
MNKGPFKMKAGKEGPMRKNFPSAFKNKDNKSVQDNTRTTKARKVHLLEDEYSPGGKEKDDYLGDFFNIETDRQKQYKIIDANKANSKANEKKKLQEANAKKQAKIAKKEADYMQKAKALVKSGNLKKGKNYQTIDDLNKKIKIIRDNS